MSLDGPNLDMNGWFRSQYFFLRTGSSSNRKKTTRVRDQDLTIDMADDVIG